MARKIRIGNNIRCPFQLYLPMVPICLINSGEGQALCLILDKVLEPDPMDTSSCTGMWPGLHNDMRNYA